MFQWRIKLFDLELALLVYVALVSRSGKIFKLDNKDLGKTPSGM